MAKKVFNMEGGLHSANAFTAFEARAYGSCVASPTSLKVVPASGMTVRVSVGDGIIDGQTPRRVQIDAVEDITLTPASTSYARKDLIVAYIDSSISPTTSVVDNTNNILKFVAVNGTPSAVPATPSSGEIQAKIGAGNQYMILAEINVAQNAVSILENAISDKRNVITIVPVESLSGKITGSQIESSTIGADNINFASLCVKFNIQLKPFSEESFSSFNGIAKDQYISIVKTGSYVPDARKYMWFVANDNNWQIIHKIISTYADGLAIRTWRMDGLTSQISLGLGSYRPDVRLLGIQIEK